MTAAIAIAGVVLLALALGLLGAYGNGKRFRWEGRMESGGSKWLYLVGRRIAILVGHNERDPGATVPPAGDGYEEHQLVRDIGAQALLALTAAGADASLIEGLWPEKAAACRGFKPEAAIELHVNSVESVNPRGYEIFYHQKDDTDAIVLAQFIAAYYRDLLPPHGQAVKSMLEQNPVRDRLWRTVLARPLLLLECGFVSNDIDRGFLLEPTNYPLIANAIGYGLNGFFFCKSKGTSASGHGGGMSKPG